MKGKDNGKVKGNVIDDPENNSGYEEVSTKQVIENVYALLSIIHSENMDILGLMTSLCTGETRQILEDRIDTYDAMILKLMPKSIYKS